MTARKQLTSLHVPQPKLPFDADVVMKRLQHAVACQTPAAMFQLKAEGFDTVFQILVSCVISIRTLEEVTLPASRTLFATASTPAAVVKLSVGQIDQLIQPCTFHRPKAQTIRDIAVAALDRFDGELPCDFAALVALKGIGPKCANLTLGVACGQPHGIPVDIHVHRVTNRWGIAASSTPEKTQMALEKVLPQRFWTEINRVLVPFGKFVCTARLPKCSTCPVLDYCKQIAVTTHR